MKKTTLTILVALFVTWGSQAQEKQTATHAKNGAEVDVLWPIFPGAFRAQYTRTLWQKGNLKGDLILGVNIDFPQDRPTEGTFSDYSIVTGYRQYFYKGFHAEFNQTTGLGVLEDHVTTGKTYNSFDWLVNLSVGYKIPFGKSRFYLTPQLGFAYVVYKSNPWPIYEDDGLSTEVGESPFFQGAVRLGINF
jgi:hypothetical protein